MRLQQMVHEVAPGAQLHIATSGAVDARRSAVKVADVERTLKRKVDCQIPADAAAALAAINFGKPLSEAAPNSGIVKALRPLVGGLDAPGGGERRASPEGVGPAWPVRPGPEEEDSGRCSVCPNKQPQEAPARRQGRSTASAGARRARRGPRRPRRRPTARRALARPLRPLREAVEPRLRALVKAGAPAGEITRQAGQLAQVHFRGNGVLLAPLELRGYVADVLRPVLPATSFSTPAAPSRGAAGAGSAGGSDARRARRRTCRSAGPAGAVLPPPGRSTRGQVGYGGPSRPAACRAARSTRRAAPCSRGS